MQAILWIMLVSLYDHVNNFVECFMIFYKSVVIWLDMINNRVHLLFYCPIKLKKRFVTDTFSSFYPPPCIIDKTKYCPESACLQEHTALNRSVHKGISQWTKKTSLKIKKKLGTSFRQTNCNVYIKTLTCWTQWTSVIIQQSFYLYIGLYFSYRVRTWIIVSTGKKRRHAQDVVKYIWFSHHETF